jgi:hypothetical protein
VLVALLKGPKPSAAWRVAIGGYVAQLLRSYFAAVLAHLGSIRSESG